MDRNVKAKDSRRHDEADEVSYQHRGWRERLGNESCYREHCDDEADQREANVPRLPTVVKAVSWMSRRSIVPLEAYTSSMTGTLSWTLVSWCDLVRLSESLHEKRPMRASKRTHCAAQHGQSIDFLHLDRLKWDWWRWVPDIVTADSGGEDEPRDQQTGMPLEIY